MRIKTLQSKNIITSVNISCDEIITTIYYYYSFIVYIIHVYNIISWHLRTYSILCFLFQCENIFPRVKPAPDDKVFTDVSNSLFYTVYSMRCG